MFAQNSLLVKQSKILLVMQYHFDLWPILHSLSMHWITCLFIGTLPSDDPEWRGHIIWHSSSTDEHTVLSGVLIPQVIMTQCTHNDAQSTTMSTVLCLCWHYTQVPRKQISISSFLTTTIPIQYCINLMATLDTAIIIISCSTSKNSRRCTVYNEYSCYIV